MIFRQLCSPVLLLLFTASCGPALKGSDTFTPKRVRTVMFEDHCKLQGYFDQSPKPLRPRANQTVSADGPQAVGEAMYELDKTPTRKRFLELLPLIYKRLPPLDPTKRITVTLRYHMMRDIQTLPIGAGVPVSGTHAEKKKSIEFTLPYHPCVGAFFFGAKYYEARRSLR